MPVVRWGQLLLGNPLGLPLVEVQVLGGVEQGWLVCIVEAARDQEQPQVHLVGLGDHLEVLVLGSE